MVDIEYVTKDEDDEWSDSLEGSHTPKMQEFSMIRMSAHVSFHSYVEKAMTLSKAIGMMLLRSNKLNGSWMELRTSTRLQN